MIIFIRWCHCTYS